MTAALLAAALPTLAAQQTAVAAGRLVRVTGADTVAAGPARVVLHRIGRDAQGPMDSLLTGADGRFRFRFPADTTALFLLSARYAGIEYFSTPVATNPATPDTMLVLVVSDTSSRAPVEVAMRHLVVAAPEGPGGRTVVDFLVVRNAGTSTRVAVGPDAAVFAIPLPPRAVAVQVEQETEFSADGVRVRDGWLEILAPLAPGEKQILLRYEVPARVRRFEVPLGGPIPTLSVMVEEPETRFEGVTLEPTEGSTIDGVAFHRFAGAAASAGPLALHFPFTGLAPGTMLLFLVGGTVAAFLIVAVLLLRKRRAAVAHVQTGTPEDLLDAIARLDARWAGRESEVDAEAWAGYQREREALKARLRGGLAGGSAGS